MSERERENPLSVICGHDKTSDNLCHLVLQTRRAIARDRESERARERESERARERESERAREQERESERESVAERAGGGTGARFQDIRAR